MPPTFSPFPGIIMLGRFMPAEGKSLGYFNQHVGCTIRAAHALEELVSDLPNAKMHTHDVQNFEEEADHITHNTVELLHKILITPLDRDEIHKLITAIDDILNLIEDVSLIISLYGVINVTDEARRLATTCAACCEEVRKTVVLSSDMSNGCQILTIVREIDRLESNTDRVMRTAMAKLFRTEDDIKLLIKLKTIYKQLKSITDRYEDVVNIIEGIVLENA